MDGVSGVPRETLEVRLEFTSSLGHMNLSDGTRVNRLCLRLKISRIKWSARRVIRSRGVPCKAWWFGAYYINPKHLVFVLAVATDRERSQLRGDPEVSAELRNLLELFDWPEPARPHVIFDIESRETVVREYEGSWWHRYK